MDTATTANQEVSTSRDGKVKLPLTEVPNELTNLLFDFTVAALIKKPSNLAQFAADYFKNIAEQGYVPDTSAKLSLVSQDEDSYSADFAPPIKQSFNRRKSVFAEHYDPAEDDDEDQTQKSYPKSDLQRKNLADAIKNILLFRSLDGQDLCEVLDAMFERKVKPGELVIKQGEDGDYFYVIEEGRYKVIITDDNGVDKEIQEYNDSGSFGELALMYNMPRSATVKALSNGSLWAMNRQTFRKIILKRAFQKRKGYEQLLEKVEMLKSLETYERMNLCDALVPKNFPDGSIIIKEGDEADGMYFVEAGTVKVTKTNENGEQRELTRLGKGSYFGELALITHKPRAASIIAEGDVKVAFLDVGAFERLLGPCMNIMKRNFNDYEQQLVKIFGSKPNISDLRTM